MVNTILVQLLVVLFSFSLFAKVDKSLPEAYVGERRLDSYFERYSPLVARDPYSGKISFQDDLFFQNFFNPYLLLHYEEYSHFFQSELPAGMLCPNELLAEHFDEIRFSYRLITLSYLIESQWHLKLMSDHLQLKKGCGFEVDKWIKSCRPKTPEMKKFVQGIEHYKPRYDESLPKTYTRSAWLQELSGSSPKWYSQVRLKTECEGNCQESELGDHFQRVCEEDQAIMSSICSEIDDVYGLSKQRDAYYLIGLSNIINTYNQKGEAMACLKRFSEVMAPREVQYGAIKDLFPSLQNFLRQKYQERFLQGRVFFFGSGKEFEQKGLTDLYVKEQPLKIEKVPAKVTAVKVEAPVVTEAPLKAVTPEKIVPIVKEIPPIKKEEIKEIRTPMKSAFLQAAEVRSQDNLEKVDVDMLKLKYDYVFSLKMINTLSERLKTFMTRDALVEMVKYDKLGKKEAPVPLLFLKYMIDMQEHHGLWNVVSVLGNSFYVSNEIDSGFQTVAEFIELKNDQSTSNQWQLSVLRP